MARRQKWSPLHAAIATLLATLLAQQPSASLAVEPLVTAASALPDSGLGPTTAPPWNPPRAIARRRPWEQAVLLPGRIATLPLSALGWSAEHTLLWAEDRGLFHGPSTVRKAANAPFGVRFHGPALGDRVGFGGTAEVNTSFLKRRNRTYVTVAQSSTQHDYQDTHVTLFRNLPIEYDHQWRPWDRFYGVGMGSSIDSLIDFATLTQSYKATAHIQWNRRDVTRAPRTEAAAWLGSRGTVIRRGREPGTSTLGQRFPEITDALLDRRFEQLVYGARFASDWRVGAPHWTEGWRVLIQSERYDKPLGWTSLVTTNPGAQFTRTTVELETGFSFMRAPRSLRVMGRVVDTGVSSGLDRMRLDDYAQLGGRTGLRRFPPGRFHDLDLVLGRLSYVFPLQRFFEMEAHVETGAVYPNLTRAPRLDQLEQSFGLLFRPRSDQHPLASAGIEWSKEAVRLVFTLSDPDK